MTARRALVKKELLLNSANTENCREEESLLKSIEHQFLCRLDRAPIDFDCIEREIISDICLGSFGGNTHICPRR